MQDRIKEHDRDIRFVRAETSAVSEHAHNTGHKPLWNEVKFIDRDPHYYTRRVKEAKTCLRFHLRTPPCWLVSTLLVLLLMTHDHLFCVFGLFLTLVSVKHHYTVFIRQRDRLLAKKNPKLGDIGFSFKKRATARKGHACSFLNNFLLFFLQLHIHNSFKSIYRNYWPDNNNFTLLLS